MTQHATCAPRSVLRTPLVAVAAAALGLAAAGPAAAAPPQQALVAVQSAGAEAIEGSYIVTLTGGADAEAVAEDLGVVPDEVYDVVVDGFAADLDAAELAELQRDPDVLAIEEDAVVTLDATQRVAVGGGLYGLDRIDQRNRPLSGTYTYGTTASGVTAYVIDTGIATAHPDFGGRASNVYDALGGNGQDCNGHGTHVAGTVGGATHGVAKGVRLRGLRVLGCDGSGSTSGIIAAVDWVRANAAKPAVANMSLGGGYSAALNRAVDSLAASGVSVAVAAGNENQDACGVSPASAAGALTVAASDKADARASFSNYGSCAEIYAPGVDITSTWLSGGTRTISGTSMASPHVAGAMALVKARYGDLPSSEVSATLVQGATTGVISRNVGSTPNRLLFKGSL
ncbi:S8 family peptidase [uncultured Pseudokineococcus sp.]|uniref:S8 family peptidase n=1 Tax=uncultured Pseudokineococcus sp. TaxID=1642928 RepID=UPI00262A5D6A|nr:S8 family peptidase [uncultured Pseudokineococcus sp.]